MNYYIHNATEGYDNPYKFNIRKTILEILKSYGIFQHLRDTPLSKLDYNNVGDWLWNTKAVEEDVNHWKQKIEELKKQLKDGFPEDDIKLEYEKEVTRLNWYNNPESNYYSKKVEKISKCLDVYTNGIDHFKKVSEGRNSFIIPILEDALDTAHKDLVGAEESLKQEDKRREKKSYEIPTYEQFKLNYIKRKEDWLKEFESNLKNKKQSLKRMQENNNTIREIFEDIEKTEKLILGE